MAKLTFDDVCEMIHEGQYVDSNNVRADALQRQIWIAEWHIPGCLSESQTICLTKTDAINAALDFAAGSDGPPRGMRADLERFGKSDKVSPDAYVSMAITTITKHRLRDIL